MYCLLTVKQARVPSHSYRSIKLTIAEAFTDDNRCTFIVELFTISIATKAVQ